VVPITSGRCWVTTAARLLAGGKDFLQAKLTVTEYGSKGESHGNLR
jgi:hypothetical protein